MSRPFPENKNKNKTTILQNFTPKIYHALNNGGLLNKTFGYASSSSSSSSSTLSTDIDRFTT
jgi:hypothetical protein